jgi:hypothetical protein
VFSLIPSPLPHALRSPRIITAVSVGTIAAIGIASYMLTRKRPTAEEIERARRDLLATSGRITDGTILDTIIEPDPSNSQHLIESDDPDPTPHTILYGYRIAGVTYECAQDVTTLPQQVHGIRTDLPIQVRYDPHTPTNSIVVAESWSGLRLTSSHPYMADTEAKTS